MQTIKKQITKQIELQEMNLIENIKERILNTNKLAENNDCPEEVQKAIQAIRQKMSQSKFSDLHPPFLQKTITKYRHEYFLPIKKQYHAKINSSNMEDFKKSISILHSFVAHMDCEYMEIYLEQIRQPYIRKIFNENYEFDKIDFKEINNEYKIRSQIQNLLNSASEWLIQIQLTQDLLDRIELYFDIRTPMMIQKAKKEGIEAKKERGWGEWLSSITRNLTSYTLRKSSKIIQSTFFTAVAPAAAMLTLAIIGGSATLPWQSDLNGKLLVAPILAVAVPYALDSLASTVQRKEFKSMLEQWAISLEQVAKSIAKFNEQTEESLLICCSSNSPEQFAKEKVNLEKIVHAVTSNLDSLTNFNEQKFQELRDRTDAYFQRYTEYQEGQWTVVIPEQEANLGAKTQKK